MIKKTIISAIVFIALHAVFVFAVVKRFMVEPLPSAQNQLQTNIINAQRFLYSENDIARNVIAGSSLSNRIYTERLPQTVNISFGGQSIFDGLNMLRRKEQFPVNIFIEMNYVLTEENTTFDSYMTNPVLYNLRKSAPSLRSEYQPVGLFVIMSRDLVARYMPRMPDVATAGEVTAYNPLFDMFFKSLEFQIQEYSKIPKQDVLDKTFLKLKKYVADLEMNGVNVVFFEMPVNAKLCNLPKAKIIRQAFYDNFPPSKYKYIYMPDCSYYMTSDGVHLLLEEALSYTEYFRVQAGAYGQ